MLLGALEQQQACELRHNQNYNGLCGSAIGNGDRGRLGDGEGDGNGDGDGDGDRERD